MGVATGDLEGAVANFTAWACKAAKADVVDVLEKKNYRKHSGSVLSAGAGLITCAKGHGHQGER